MNSKADAESRVRQIRQKAGFSITEAAALAKRSPTTWKIFEVGGSEAVSKEVAVDCMAAVREMLTRIEREVA